MSAKKHFEVVFNSVPRAGVAQESCEERADAPVCKVAEEDVTCEIDSTIYAGCDPNQTDCADNPENPDDVCCWGLGPGKGDNIDHARCTTDDAEFGSTCFWGWDGCHGNDTWPPPV